MKPFSEGDWIPRVYHEFHPNVGVNIPYMNPMGYVFQELYPLKLSFWFPAYFQGRTADIRGLWRVHKFSNLMLSRISKISSMLDGSIRGFVMTSGSSHQLIAPAIGRFG